MVCIILWLLFSNVLLIIYSMLLDINIVNPLPSCTLYIPLFIHFLVCGHLCCLHFFFLLHWTSLYITLHAHFISSRPYLSPPLRKIQPSLKHQSHFHEVFLQVSNWVYSSCPQFPCFIHQYFLFKIHKNDIYVF